MPRTRDIWALALAGALVIPLCAAGFPVLVDPQAVRETIASTGLSRYPDADSVQLAGAERVRYEPDGTSISFSESWIKVLTEKGRREHGVITFAYNAAYGGVEIPLAEIHRADGTLDIIDVAVQSREMIAPGQMHQNIFDPQQKILQLGIPGLEIGDTVRVRAIRRQTRTRMPGTWSDFTVFEKPLPLVYAVYEVDAPAALPLINRCLKAEITGTVVYEDQSLPDGAMRHRWIVRNVPRLFEEPAMPDWWTVAQRLLVSTIPDWETVSRWYWRLCLPRLEATTPAMRDKVLALTQDLPTRQERIETLFRFVSQQVRYVGITAEEVAPGYEPRDVHLTFEDRYGVCRDKAALLVAMLRLAGFEAFPVLIHAGPRKDPEVTQPFFNHAIVAVREPDGSYQLMDMTDETTRELLPAYLADMSYLVATPEGEPLLTSPVPPASANMVHIDTAAVLDADGRLSGTAHVRLDGINDNAYRGFFASVKPVERRRFFEGLVKQVLPGSELVGFQLRPDDMQDVSQPIAAVLEFAVPDYPLVSGGTVMLPPPWFGTALGMVNFILRNTGLHQRRFPLVTRYACGVTESFTLNFQDAGLGPPAALPEFRPIASPTLAWRQELLWRTNALEGRARFKLPVTEFDPEQYVDLRAMLGEIEHNRRKWPVFAGAGTPATADMPDADVAYAFRKTDLEVESDSVWTETRRVRKTVLTYAGIKQHSELVLPFNPVWDEVELVEAMVTAPDGTIARVRDDAINIMDAAWVGSAPRYPPGRLMVVNLPGVRVGSTIDITTRRRRRDRPFFSFRESFGGIEPVGRLELTLLAPDDFIPATRIFGGQGTVDLLEDVPVNGYRRRRWLCRAPVTAVREDDLPPDWIIYPSLLVSGGDWAQYADHLAQHLLAAAAQSAESAVTAHVLVADVADPGARLRIIRDFVARRIRGAGPSFMQLPLEALSPADQTLRDGYGHGADRAVLLHAMLRAAGFDPQFLLVSRWPYAAAVADAPLAIPQQGLFNRLLVKVVHEGAVYYLNDTDQYAEPGATPSEGLLAMRLADGAIMAVSVDDDMSSRVHTEYRIRLENDGAAAVDVVQRYAGMAHAHTRRLFDEMTPEDRRRHHQELVTAVSQRALPDGDMYTAFDRHPGELRFAVQIDRFAVVNDGMYYVHLPGAGMGLPVRADRRTNPLWWSTLARESVLHSVRLPAGMAIVMTPPAQSWSAPDSTFTVTRRIRAPGDDDAEWEMETLTERNPGLIDPVYYPALLQVDRRLSHHRNRVMIFEPPGQGEH